MTRTFNAFLPLCGVLAFVTVIHATWWLVGSTPPEQSYFSDGDSYLRLLRVEALLQTGHWLDNSISDINAPYGATLHWTRLFDLILIGFALPLMPFVGVTKALFWAGMFISPILHIVSAGVLVWALGPFIGRKGACLAGALSASQVGILAFSTFGHADHHMMFVLLTTLSLGLVCRLVLNVENIRRNSLSLGATLGIGIWVGPEYLVFTGICLAIMGVYWIADSPGSLRKNSGIALGLALALVIATIIERGVVGFVDIEYDRLSIVHVVFGSLLTTFWFGVSVLVAKLTDRRPSHLSTPLFRLLIATVGALTLGLIMVFLFPKVAGNPLNDVDPALLPIFSMISEYRAIADPARFLIYFGSAVFVLPWLCWRLRMSWGEPSSWIWMLLGVSLVVYLGFATMWLRWCLYAGLFMIILIADVTSELDRWISNRYAFPLRVPVKVVLLLAIIIGPLVVGGVLLRVNKVSENQVASGNPECSVTVLSAYLTTIDKPMTIVASANFGPAIVYYTDHRVLATVHHRNADGILDGYKILAETDDTVVQALISKRHVNAVILCPETSNDAYFRQEDSEDSLYRRLIVNDPPGYLAAVPLPSSLKSSFRFYQVSGSSQ